MLRAMSVACVGVGLMFVAGLLAQEDTKEKPQESPEQKAVRVYLKDHLPSGEWEELKWWRPRDIRNGKRSIRLKYRSANTVGAKQVFDDAFYFKEGKLIEWHKNEGKLFHGFDNEK